MSAKWTTVGKEAAFKTASPAHVGGGQVGVQTHDVSGLKMFLLLFENLHYVDLTLL